MEAALLTAVEQLPAVSLTGPRGAGKTTTAWRHAASRFNLASDREAGLFRPDPQRLTRLFEALARNSAGVIEDKALGDSAGLDRRTALGYEGLLRRLLVIDELPAWWSNRLARLVARPKRFVMDTSLMATGLRLNRAGVEVKPTLAPDRSDAKNLAWLRGQLGQRFVSGPVLHTGPATFELEDRILAAPISTLWA